MYARGKIVKKKHRSSENCKNTFLLAPYHLQVETNPRVSQSHKKDAWACRFFRLPFDIYTETEVKQGAVMVTQKRGSQRIGSVLGGAITLLGLARWIGGLGHAACLLSVLFEIPPRIELGAVSSVLLATWQVLVPCLFGRTRLLESLLQVTVCGWQLVLTLLGAA